MIVSRRSMLLSQPSNALMRCAGRAASKRGVEAAFRQFSEMMQRAKPVTMNGRQALVVEPRK